MADAADAASYTLEYEEFKQAVGKVNTAKNRRQHRREPLIFMNTIYKSYFCIYFGINMPLIYIYTYNVCVCVCVCVCIYVCIYIFIYVYI